MLFLAIVGRVRKRIVQLTGIHRGATLQVKRRRQRATISRRAMLQRRSQLRSSKKRQISRARERPTRIESANAVTLDNAFLRDRVSLRAESKVGCACFFSLFWMLRTHLKRSGLIC